MFFRKTLPPTSRPLDEASTLKAFMEPPAEKVISPLLLFTVFQPAGPAASPNVIASNSEIVIPVPALAEMEFNFVRRAMSIAAAMRAVVAVTSMLRANGSFEPTRPVETMVATPTGALTSPTRMLLGAVVSVPVVVRKI